MFHTTKPFLMAVSGVDYKKSSAYETSERYRKLRFRFSGTVTEHENNFLVGVANVDWSQIRSLALRSITSTVAFSPGCFAAKRPHILSQQSIKKHHKLPQSSHFVF